MSLTETIQEKFREIVEHPDFDLNVINPSIREEAPWDRHKLTHHPNFQLEWLTHVHDFNHEDDYYPSNWDWDLISQHPNVNDEFLFNHIDTFYGDKLNFQLLSKHPNFNHLWMNRHIGAAWDLDYIVQRSDFTSDDLLKVFLKPTQKWNYDLISKKFGQEWCVIFLKVQKKDDGFIF